MIVLAIASLLMSGFLLGLLAADWYREPEHHPRSIRRWLW